MRSQTMEKSIRFLERVGVGVFVFGALMAFLAPHADAASTCTFASAGDNDWNTAANWSCSGAVNAVPTSTTDVVIPAATGTTIGANATAGTLSIAATANVTTTAGIFSVGSSSTNAGIFYVNAGTVELATSTLGTTTNNGSMIITTGSVSSTGPYTNGGTTSITTGFIAFGDAFTNTGTFTPGTGTVRLYTGTTASIAGAVYNNVLSMKSGGVATFAASSTIGGTLVTSVGGSVGAATAGLTIIGNTTIGASTTLLVNAGTVTSTGSLTNAGTLNGGTGTLVIAWTFSSAGTFTPSTGTVRYASSTTQNVLATVYNNLDIRNTSAGGAALTASTTALGTLAVQSGATLNVVTFTFTVLGLITNVGTMSETGAGTIVHAAESVKVTNSSGTETASFATGDSLYVTIQDSNRNLDGTAVETMTVTLAGNSAAGSDSETLTLTETGVATGIFRNTTGIVFANSTAVSLGNGQLEVTATGVGTGSYTDNQDATDTGSDTATLSYTAAAAVASTGGGGGGGSSYIPITITSQVSTQSNTANLTNLQNIGVAVHNLVKLPNDGDASTQYDSAVYYVGSDGKRHAFPNDKVYFTWYANFDGVQVINQTQLASIPLGSNVTYKPGVKMVKFTTDPKVYVVAKGGILRWVSTEEAAVALYGSTWNTKIDDISDAFYANYTFGTSVTGLADFNPTSVTASVSLPSDSLQM